MHVMNTALLALCNFVAISHSEPDPDIHLHLYLPPEFREGTYPETSRWLLAPTGALIVIVVYYTTSAAARPLFEISSISANIFSFSF